MSENNLDFNSDFENKEIPVKTEELVEEQNNNKNASDDESSTEENLENNDDLNDSDKGELEQESNKSFNNQKTSIKEALNVTWIFLAIISLLLLAIMTIALTLPIFDYRGRAVYKDEYVKVQVKTKWNKKNYKIKVIPSDNDFDYYTSSTYSTSDMLGNEKAIWEHSNSIGTLTTIDIDYYIDLDNDYSYDSGEFKSDTVSIYWEDHVILVNDELI